MESEILFRQVNLHKARAAASILGEQVSSNPSICLLTEPYTAFGRVAQIPNNHRCAPNITMKSRPRAAILIPKHMPFVYLEQLSNPDMTAILLETSRGKILLASIYLDSKLAVVQPWLTKLADFAENKRFPLIYALDSNAHSVMYGPDTNERGEIFEDFILKYNLKVENVGQVPTYHAFRQNAEIGTCIDVTLSQGLVPLNGWRVDQYTFNGSDHHTITWSLPVELPPPKRIRPWSSAKWDIFQHELNKHTFDLPLNFNTRKVDKFLNGIYKVINDALDVACPMRDAKASPIEIAWYGRDQKRLKNRAQRRYLAYKQEPGPHRRKAFVAAKRAYAASCRRAKHSAWREFVEKTPDIASMTKLAKIAQRKDSRNINTLLKSDLTLTDPGADTIRVLTSTHFPAATEGVAEMQHINSHKIPTKDIQEAFGEWIDEGLVRKALCQFKPMKAPGPDGLKPIVFRHLPDHVISAITLVYQACIALKHTPKVWRDTRVIFIPKPGKDSYDLPKSYRPVSLSNFLLKGLERLVVWKMDKDLEEAPIHPKQHGFTKGKSTESAISNTVDYIEQHLFDDSHCLGMFLDISSAFDSISIDHIKECLLQHNGDPDLVEWYHSYLAKRHLEVELHGETVHLTTGTGFPQGGVCSARFWLIAFDEAIKIINTRGIVGNGYADDCSALLGGTHPDNMIESMQAMLEQLVAWGATCGLRFNPAKTVAVMFTRSQREFTRLVQMDGQLIPYSSSVLYLGVTLDYKLHWREHIINKRNKAKALYMKLSSLTSSYWGPKPKLLKWAYTGLVRPVMSYASMIWGHRVEADDIEEELRKLNRAALLSICRVPRSTPTRALEIILDIFPLHIFIIRTGLAAFQRLKRQTPLLWDGVYPNLTHSISHLRFWTYLCQELGIDDVERNSDSCCIVPPELNFALDANSFVDMDSSKDPVQCNVYTDGSKKNDQVGAGVFIQRKDTQHIKESFRLPDHSTVFQAEVAAIREAAKLLQHLDDLTEIKFFVDSQAALRTFHKGIITSKLVYQTILELNLIRAKHILFVWTRAHVGHEGNEQADALAKLGTTASNVLDVLPPAVDSKEHLTTSLRSKWNKEWDSHTECRQSKLFHPQQDKQIADHVILWDRLKLGRYIRAVTGHNNLLYHLHNMHNIISPICRFCLDAYEEFYHLAYHCPALWWERHLIDAQEQDRQENWTPDQIIDFALSPKLNDAFVRPLYWIEENTEMREIPSQATQTQHTRNITNSSVSTISDVSVMDVTSIDSPPTDTSDSDIAD